MQIVKILILVVSPSYGSSASTPKHCPEGCGISRVMWGVWRGVAMEAGKSVKLEALDATREVQISHWIQSFSHAMGCMYRVSDATAASLSEHYLLCLSCWTGVLDSRTLSRPLSLAMCQARGNPQLPSSHIIATLYFSGWGTQSFKVHIKIW